MPECPSKQCRKPGRTRDDGWARWWLISLVFHGLLIAWLVFFSPVRLLDTTGGRVRVSSTEARKFVRDMQQRQIPSLGQNLRTLADLRDKMAALEGRKRSEFAHFAQGLMQEAPAKLQEQQQCIARLQAGAAQDLERAGDNASQFVQTRANAFYGDMEDAQRLAADTQAGIQLQMDKAQALLSMGDTSFAGALAAQRAAREVQDRAAQALLAAEKARSPSRGTTRRTARQGQIEHYTYHLWRTRDTVTNAAANLEKAKKEVVVTEAVNAWAVNNLARVETNAAALDPESGRLAMDKARKTLDRAGRNLAFARKQLEEIPQKLAAAQKDLPGLEAKVAELLAQEEPAPVELSPEDRHLIEVQSVARQLQLEAQAAQSAVTDLISHLSGIDTNALSSVNFTAALDGATSAPAPLPGDLEKMDLARIYDAAVRIEDSLVQSYRRVRATQLAILQGISLSRAMDLTEVARPMRPDLSAGLTAQVSTGDQAVAVREALQAARMQVNSMVELAGSMLAQAQLLDSPSGTPISWQQYEQQSGLESEIARLASEDNGYATDLTGAMKETGGTGDGSGGQAQGKRGGQGGQSGQGGRGSGGTGGGGGMDLGFSGPEGPFGFGGLGHAGIAGASGEAGRPEDVSERVHPLPGRRVGLASASPQWLYVDSWYVIGPFDNTDRRNIEKKFPPETVVDLNASYPGKDGVQIRWEFQQSGTPNICPLFKAYNAARSDPALSGPDQEMHNAEYVIYYAYSELSFEKECDLWVAVGSDDFSRLWIEDHLVWSSGKQLKAWQLNEGLRRVHFKRGINRVLFRVENGNNITEFSLVLSLVP
jgi:hypothetical protein